VTTPAIFFIFIYSYESLKLQKIIQVTIFPSFFCERSACTWVLLITFSQTFLCRRRWPLALGNNASWQHQHHHEPRIQCIRDLVREGVFTTRLYSNQYTAFSTKLTSPTVAPAPPTRAATAAAPLTQARCQEQFAVCPRRLSSWILTDLGRISYWRYHYVALLLSRNKIISFLCFLENHA
jgi:hypothetical protein